MKIVIHAGMDKTGSTAIQSFLNFYRSQLLELGVYVPVTGWSGVGHVELLKDLGDGLWGELHEELRSPEAAGSKCVVLSWEGVFFYRPEKVQALAEHLRDYETRVLFYLRDQVEIIQSGYLQKIKAGPQKILLSHFKTNPALLEPSGRNYLGVFRKFESAFGREALLGKVYDRELFPQGSVIYDFMTALGFGEESFFSDAPTQHQRQPGCPFCAAS